MKAKIMWKTPLKYKFAIILNYAIARVIIIKFCSKYLCFYSKVPSEYLANYKIQKDRKRLSELFIDIDAENKNLKN